MIENPQVSRAAFEKFQANWQSLRRPIRLLLVEDNPNDIELINRTLDGRLEIMVALTGSQAIKLIGNLDYDVCLLDLKLPDMSGHEVILWAKKHNKDVPFFALTGISDKSPAIKDALDAGAECVIQKPLSSENARMIMGARR